MKKSLTQATAFAPATVANQFTFDGGGFPATVLAVIAGDSEDWETLFDTVQVTIKPGSGSIKVQNIVHEVGGDRLSTDVMENTGARTIQLVKEKMAPSPLETCDISIKVEKGLSLKGTGLGSSGATPAAALKALEWAYEKYFEEALPLSDLDKATILMAADFGVPDNSIPAYLGNVVQIEINEQVVTALTQVKKAANFGYFVIVTPHGFGIKTSDAREAIKGMTPPPNINELSEKMKMALETGDAVNYGKQMEAAHEWFVGGKRKAARSRLYPHQGTLYDDVAEQARVAGATGVTISGAGPTMLAVVPNELIGKKVGQAMHDAFKAGGYSAISRLIDVNPHGATLLTD